MAIDRNTIVSIPDGAYVEKDQTVFVKDVNVYDPEKKYFRVKHTIIGRRISDGKMYPNTNYAKRYPLLYEQASGQKLRRRTMNIGVYIVVLAIATKLRLYEILEKCFGIENANLVLDFSMYSMIFHSCESDRYPSLMKDQMTFSNSLGAPSRLSAFFTEPRISEFKRLWAQHSMENGVSEVWIVIDGSYMHVVDATSADPVSIFVSGGGRIDCKDVMEVIGWLSAYKMKAKGAIVDCGFVTEGLLKEFDKYGIEYVAMLNDNSLAHKEMVSKYADKIRMKYEFMLGKYRQDKDSANDSPVLYGISSTGKIKIFADHSYKAYAHLIFDRQSGEERRDVWYREVTEKAYVLQSELKSGKQVIIPDEFKDCITKVNDTILVDENKVQSIGDEKGYFTLASSSKMDAEEANNIYSLRNTMQKSQIADDSIVAKLFVAFVTSIIQNEILKTVKKLKIPMIIEELDNIKIYLDNEDKYYVCHTVAQKEIDFLKYWDFEPDMIDGLVTMLNENTSVKAPNLHHKLPEIKTKERRGPGRPHGSKNILPKPKMKPDRPLGKTIENEILTAKRGPGRPKGAKNKPKPVGETVKR